MFNEDTTNLIDYAYQDNGTAFRDSLYNAIHDKVSAHIEAKKQEIAAGLMGQQEEYVEESKKDDDLASSSKPSIFSAKANKEFDRVKNLSDKDSKYYHDTQIRNAQLSQRLRMGLREDEALEEGRKPSLITGTRKIASYEGDHGHTAEVRHSREYNEYQVHHYKNGVHQGEGPISYHGDDKEGAHDNAKYEVGMQPEIIKKK